MCLSSYTRNLFPLIPILGLPVLGVIDLCGRIDWGREVVQEGSVIHDLVVDGRLEGVVRPDDQPVEMGPLVLEVLLEGAPLLRVQLLAVLLFDRLVLGIDVSV